MCHAARFTESASSTSACVNALPFHVAPNIDSKLVHKSIPIHLCFHCSGVSDTYSFSSSSLPLTTILFHSCSIVTAFWFACRSAWFTFSNFAAVTVKSSVKVHVDNT